MSQSPDVTLFHNPACGTSRKVLALIEAAGLRPTVVEYLQVGWTVSGLRTLLADMGARPLDILRRKNSPSAELVAELGLLEGKDDADILAAMVRHPILVERPIVVTGKGTRLCRPAETVLEIL